MYIIDDLNGIDAAYEFAGVVGIHPRGMTLRQLWRMANGRAKQSRREAFDLVRIAFNDSLDVLTFLNTGSVVESCVGKPLELSPEMESAVQAEVEKIRRENPNLPQVLAIRSQ